MIIIYNFISNLMRSSLKLLLINPINVENNIVIASFCEINSTLITITVCANIPLYIPVSTYQFVFFIDTRLKLYT